MNFKVDILKGEKELNALDDNVDVEVTMEDGTVYGATFFTLKNIKTLLDSYRESGECSNGLYIWSSDMILVDKLTDETIKKSIVDLVDTGEIESACTSWKVSH